jgi:hypothetical protein
VQNALYVFKSSGQYTGAIPPHQRDDRSGGANVLPVLSFFRAHRGQTDGLNSNAERLTTSAARQHPLADLTLRSATDGYVLLSRGHRQLRPRLRRRRPAQRQR